MERAREVDKISEARSRGLCGEWWSRSTCLTACEEAHYSAWRFLLQGPQGHWTSDYHSLYYLLYTLLFTSQSHQWGCKIFDARNYDDLIPFRQGLCLNYFCLLIAYYGAGTWWPSVHVLGQSFSFSHVWILWLHGLYPASLLCPWDFPDKNTGMGCHFLLQGIFLSQGSNPGLLHCRQILYWLSHQEAQNAYVLCLVIQSYPTLCDLMDCSLPGSFVLGDSPGKNIGVGFYAVLQEIFPSQGSNPGLLHCRQILYHLSHQESPVHV